MVGRRTDPVPEGSGQTGKHHESVSSPGLTRVNLADIDRSDECFSMSFEPDLGRLTDSVKRVGLLNPLWLRRKGRKFQIVSGFRRFDVVHLLGTRQINALVWREEELEDRLSFQRSLHENILTRGLNLVEKGVVLEKLLGRFSVSRNEVRRTFLPLLDLEPNENVLNGLLLMNTFSKDLKRYILKHRVSLGNILLLARFSGEDQKSIGNLLSPLRVGENVLREILTFLREIADRDGIGLYDLLSSQRMGSLLSDRRLSGPQKIQAIRKVLRERRYPRFSEIEERFRSCRKKMRLSPQISILPPPFFEGDRFKVEFYFRSLRDYETILGELQNLSKESIGNLLTIKGYGSDPP
jgi:hypothetical protein